MQFYFLILLAWKKSQEVFGNTLPCTDLVLVMLSSKLTLLLQFLTGCWSSIHFFPTHLLDSLYLKKLYILHFICLSCNKTFLPTFISREAYSSLTLLSVILNATFVVWGQNCSSILFNALVANTRSIMCFDIKTKIPKAEEYSYLSQEKKTKKKEKKTNVAFQILWKHINEHKDRAHVCWKCHQHCQSLHTIHILLMKYIINVILRITFSLKSVRPEICFCNENAEILFISRDF